MNPGDRVQGWGNFGKPTGEFGTIERANEDDAVVKWDGDGRMRLHQPWLKKVYLQPGWTDRPQLGQIRKFQRLALSKRPHLSTEFTALTLHTYCPNPYR
ncbi:MAG: hypothetical protein ABSE80_12050 [Halobacteriota archaeon]